MTQPRGWFPQPNPGGSYRATARRAVAQWIEGQNIAGVQHVYPGLPATWNFDGYPAGGTRYGCLVGVRIPTDSEERVAYTGQTDPGGKMLHFDVILRVYHQSFVAYEGDDTADIEDDYDRIIDALKDCFRSDGRDLNRPDVFLAVAETPRQQSFRGDHPDPFRIEGGALAREGTLSFTVTQYLPAYPAQ